MYAITNARKIFARTGNAWLLKMGAETNAAIILKKIRNTIIKSKTRI